MKANIQQMQDHYNQWVKLLPELEKGLEQWKQAARLIKTLEDFYFNPQWIALHEQFDEQLETEGNYSVLSEDALWNAFVEQKELAKQWLEQAKLTLEETE